MENQLQKREDKYPSRVTSIESIQQRLCPVVYGNGAKHQILNDEDLSFYAENGYLIKHNLLEDMVQPILDDIPKMKESLAGRDELILEPHSQEVRSVFSPQKYSSACMELAKHDQLLLAAQQILDSEVYIHHSRINVKSGLSGKSFPWHSDFETWHAEDGLPNMRILTGWVFLTENDEFNGPLFVIPQSHKAFISCIGETPEDNFKQSLRHQTYGVPSKAALEQMVDEFGMKAIHGGPGTVVFHEGNLLHGSADNLSPFPRSNIFFVYNSVENKPGKPYNGMPPRPEFLASRDTSPLTKE